MKLPGMSEFAASDLAVKLVDGLVLPDEFDVNQTIESQIDEVADTSIKCTVAIGEEFGVHRVVTLTVSVSDLVTGCTAYVATEVSVDDMHSLVPGYYRVYVSNTKNGKESEVTLINHIGITPEYIFKNLIPIQAEQFQKPTAEALQLCQRVGFDLKISFPA